MQKMKCYRAGAADFLQKPLYRAMLIFKSDKGNETSALIKELRLHSFGMPEYLKSFCRN